MSINSIANLASNVAASGADPAVGYTVLKKALNIEAATASTLLAALPPVQSTQNLPANLGRTINTTA